MMNCVDDDIDRIMAVMERAFDPTYGEAWNRQQLLGGLIMPGTRYELVDEHGAFGGGTAGPTAGFFLARQVLDEEELLLFAVRPEFRGLGLGRRLLARMFETAQANGVKTVHLEMREDNPADRLYRSFGFEQIGHRPDYYLGRDGIRRAAHTFSRLLSDEQDWLA